MSREKLFQGETVPFVVNEAYEQKVSPSPLAEYVITDMPSDLAAVRSEDMSYTDLAKKHEALLEEMRPRIEAEMDPEAAKIIQMDLLFMFGGYIPEGKKMFQAAPPSLMPLINYQADRFDGLGTFMSYELIIDANSAELLKTGNMRVYCDGEVGRHERDFYYGHHDAEQYVRNAAYLLKDLTERPQLFNPGEVFENARQSMDTFDAYMGQYGRLTKDAFREFRPYLAEYADGTRNASGAFMPSVQLLELTLHAPTPRYAEFLHESMPYFPSWAQPVISEMMVSSQAGSNIEAMIETGEISLDDEALSNLISVVNEFASFRMKHLGITKDRIPEAFSSTDNLSRRSVRTILDELQIVDPNYKGTAGFDVRNVLVNSVVRLNLLLDRLLELRDGEDAAS